jgi:hypothetical protein
MNSELSIWKQNIILSIEYLLMSFPNGCMMRISDFYVITFQNIYLGHLNKINSQKIIIHKNFPIRFEGVYIDI